MNRAICDSCAGVRAKQNVYASRIEAAGSEEVVATDGRVQRSVRSRERIVEAVMALVQEGELLPTGEQVALRADVGLRTVFRHFEDMDSLHADVQARVEKLARPILDEPVPDGPLEERVHAFVSRRGNAFERIAPFRRSGNLLEWRSAFIREERAKMAVGLRSQLREVFPEVPGLAAPLRHALEVMTSFEAWDRMRTDQGLGKERAQEAMRAGMLALLNA